MNAGCQHHPLSDQLVILRIDRNVSLWQFNQRRLFFQQLFNEFPCDPADDALSILVKSADGNNKICCRRTAKKAKPLDQGDLLAFSRRRDRGDPARRSAASNHRIIYLYGSSSLFVNRHILIPPFAYFFKRSYSFLICAISVSSSDAPHTSVSVFSTPFSASIA